MNEANTTSLIEGWVKDLITPARRAAGRFAVSPLEARVQTLEATVAEYSLTNQLLFKVAAFIAADKIPGDYLEFGVFGGNSFIAAYRACSEAFKRATSASPYNTARDRDERRQLWQEMRFLAFDSFQGLPQPTGIDTRSLDFTEGKFACSESVFRERLVEAAVPLERVTIAPGWFEETVTPESLNNLGISRAAIVYIDCDLYYSAKTVLDGITPFVDDGTIIIFDDWYNFRGDPQLGEQRACSEWLAANPQLSLTQYQKEGSWKNSFIVHRTHIAGEPE